MSKAGILGVTGQATLSTWAANGLIATDLVERRFSRSGAQLAVGHRHNREHLTREGKIYFADGRA